MDNKKTITIIILGLVAMAGILLFLFLPSKSHLANIDFYVYDTNDNFHYEVNERLELLVNDTAAIKGKRLIWEMGNGDTLMRNTDVSYTYRKAGKYLITLKIDGKHSVNKYIKVISGLEHEAIDSIPRINGVSEGYQGEELVFSAEGYGMDTWLWEFGESGTVDAYEQQVVYSYDIPGEYTISLQTNTTKYPVKHRINRRHFGHRSDVEQPFQTCRRKDYLQKNGGRCQDEGDPVQERIHRSLLGNSGREQRCAYDNHHYVLR